MMRNVSLASIDAEARWHGEVEQLQLYLGTLTTQLSSKETELNAAKAQVLALQAHVQGTSIGAGQRICICNHGEHIQRCIVPVWWVQ